MEVQETKPFLFYLTKGQEQSTHNNRLKFGQIATVLVFIAMYFISVFDMIISILQVHSVFNYQYILNLLLASY